MRKALTPILVLSGLLVAGSANAQFVYEGFNYDLAPTMPSGFASNNINGLNGGTGFQNAWGLPNASGNPWGQIVTGLNYTDGNGHALVTSGNALQIGTNGGFASASTPQRIFTNSSSAANLGLLAAANSSTPGVIWMSFLYQREGDSTGAPFFRQSNLGLFQGTSEKLDVGGPNTSASVNNNLSVWSTGTGGTAHPGSAPLQSTTPVFSANAQFIVLELTVDTTTANDGVSVWFNPTDLSNLGAPTLTSTAEVDLSGVNDLRFQAGGSNANGTNALFLADEFRIGYTVGDVTPFTIVPEPTAIAFATIGGISLYVWRRRRSLQ
jgi:hypothetical protein